MCSQHSKAERLTTCSNMVGSGNPLGNKAIQEGPQKRITGCEYGELRQKLGTSNYLEEAKLPLLRQAYMNKTGTVLCEMARIPSPELGAPCEHWNENVKGRTVRFEQILTSHSCSSVLNLRWSLTHHWSMLLRALALRWTSQQDTRVPLYTPKVCFNLFFLCLVKSHSPLKVQRSSPTFVKISRSFYFVLHLTFHTSTPRTHWEGLYSDCVCSTCLGISRI